MSSQRIGAIFDLVDQRAELVRSLMAIIDGNYSDYAKVNAIIVLADYRAPEVVPFLVQHLEWDDIHSLGHPIISTNGHLPMELMKVTQEPIKKALEKIGMPAIPALLDKIMQTDDANITKKCVSICQSIEGQDVTQFRLQGLLDKETDQTKKGRMQSALDALKNLNAGK
jgi:hypothetical protein